MEFNQEDERQATKTDPVKKYALKLLRRWPYIIITFIVAVSIGFAINRYATPVYMVKARITTKKFSNKPETPIPGLVDANFFLSGYTEVYEEIPLLKSPKRITAAIERLNFEVSYFSEGEIKTTESVNGFGFVVELDTIGKGQCPFGIPIYVKFKDSNRFQLQMEGNWQSLVKGKDYYFNEFINIGGARLRVINKMQGVPESNKYFFVINSMETLVNTYRNRLNIEWVQKGSSMLDLRMQSELPERDLQFMRAYYDVVQEFGIREKNETLDNTIKFIDEQMKYITDSLLYYQSLIDDLKLSNSKLNLPTPTISSNSNPSASFQQNVVTGSDYIFSKLSDLDKKKADIELKERYLNYLEDYFHKKSKDDVFAPSIMGLSMPLVETWVNQFITQKLAEKPLLNESNLQNPLVTREDSLRKKLEKGIYEAINNERQMNRQAVAELDKQADFLLSSVPDVQIDFRKLAQYQRLFQLNQSLFDLFIRRKTEAAISKASAAADYEIIEEPAYSRVPVKPDKMLNLIIAAAAGLLLPIGLFLFIDISNKRVMDKDDLIQTTQIPLLGNVAHSDYASRLVMKEYPRSVVAESFRAVRANLKFLAGNIKTKSHTFLVTSSVGGEGKTFCSLNLAYTLALGHRKTIVIGSDMRKPELGNYIETHAEKGLSTYLAGYATIEEVIFATPENEPDFIDAGKVPPNPSELLASDRMRDLIAHLKQIYDYIIIDTPPIGLVSDAMELFKYSDYNILIVRQGVTHKEALGMVNELYMEGKLKNFTLLFNDLELLHKRKSIYGGYVYGMGYGGYGYGYYQEDKNKNKKKK